MCVCIINIKSKSFLLIIRSCNICTYVEKKKKGKLKKETQMLNVQIN